MTPKEKAQELFGKYWDLCADESIDCLKLRPKKMALIAVDEIIEQNNIWIKHTGKGTNNYWQEVKAEIENL